MKTRIGAVLSHLQKLMGVGDDSSLETGSVMWGGSEGEADTSVERQTLPHRKVVRSPAQTSVQI